MTLNSYFISSPYIDAYKQSWEPSHPKISFVEFERKMQLQAWDWGEQSVGRATISALEPAMDGEDYVLAFGQFGDKKYVAISSDESEPGCIKVIEVGHIPDEWNVT